MSAARVYGLDVIPRRRHVFFAAIVVTACLGATACSGGDSGSDSSPATSVASTAPSTRPFPSTTTTVPSSGAVEISAAPWRAPAPVSREVLLTDDTSLYVLGGLDEGKSTTPAVVRIDPATGASTPAGQLAPGVHDAAGFRHGGDLVVVAGGVPPAVASVQAVTTAGATRSVGQLSAARADLVVAVVGDTAYALGGGDEKSGQTTLFDTVAASADGGATWTDAGTLTEAVRYPAVAVVDGAIYLFGGVTASGSPDTRSVQRYDPKTGATTVVAQLPAPLSHASAVTLGGRVYVVGGFVDNQVSAQALRFDPATNEIVTAGTIPVPVTDGAAVVLDDVGYYVGGQGTDRAVTDQVTVIRPAP